MKTPGPKNYEPATSSERQRAQNRLNLLRAALPEKRRAVFDVLCDEWRAGRGSALTWQEIAKEAYAEHKKVKRNHVADVLAHLPNDLEKLSSNQAIKVGVEQIHEQRPRQTLWRLKVEVGDSSNLKPPGFFWTAGKGEKVRKIPIWVPMMEEGCKILLRTIEDWKPPRNFSGYKDFRDSQWEKHVGNMRTALNTWHWHVRSFNVEKGIGARLEAIELNVGRCRFKDFVATTKSLEEQIFVSGKQQKVHDLLEAVWDRFECEHFPHAANLLAIDVNMITKDKKLVVRRDSQAGPWETALFGYVDAVKDRSRMIPHGPDYNETVFRICCDLFGFPICPSNVCWLGVGFGTAMGNVSLFGEIEVPYVAAEVEEKFRERPDKRRSVAITATTISAPGVMELITQPLCRRHVEVAIALTLRRHSKSTRCYNSASP